MVTARAIEGVHALAGLPWGGTIALCAVGVRLAALPLVVMQTRNTAKLFGLPEVVRLTTTFQQEAANAKASGKSSQATAQLFLNYVSALRKTWKLHKINPLLSFIVPVVQIPTLITFTFAARGLMYGDTHSEALQQGGAMWFTDLTAADPYFVLPALAVSTTYLSLDLSFGRGPMVFQMIGANDAYRDDSPYIQHACGCLYVLDTR